MCCKPVGGEALVATMRKYCGLVCILIVCTEPAMELVLALVTVGWWKDASQALQLASSLDQGQAYDRFYLQTLPTTEATIVRAKIAQIETATLGLQYVGKKAEAGPGGRKKSIEGNICDWMLLKKMEIKKREKTEAVTPRANAKTKRVISTRTGVGGAGSTSDAAQGARVCSTRNFTTF